MSGVAADSELLAMEIQFASCTMTEADDQRATAQIAKVLGFIRQSTKFANALKMLFKIKSED